ncbi:UNVERIFIED_ORG: hypothetical protein RHOFW104R5_19000 [Rhodanobacter sp. FW104-R5]
MRLLEHLVDLPLGRVEVAQEAPGAVRQVAVGHPLFHAWVGGFSGFGLALVHAGSQARRLPALSDARGTRSMAAATACPAARSRPKLPLPVARGESASPPVHW